MAITKRLPTIDGKLFSWKGNRGIIEMSTLLSNFNHSDWVVVDNQTTLVVRSHKTKRLMEFRRDWSRTDSDRVGENETRADMIFVSRERPEIRIYAHND